MVGALTVAQTAGTVVGQIKTAKAQTRAIRQQQATAREETRQVASAEMFDQMRASRREQGRVRAAAGEAGLGLNSMTVDQLLLDSVMQGELAGDRTIANMEARHRSNTAEAESMLSRIQRPTALGAGLQIAGAAAEAFSGVQRAKIQTRGGAR